jgi:hypothetical protein
MKIKINKLYFFLLVFYLTKFNAVFSQDRFLTNQDISGQNNYAAEYIFHDPDTLSYSESTVDKNGNRIEKKANKNKDGTYTLVTKSFENDMVVNQTQENITKAEMDLLVKRAPLMDDFRKIFQMNPWSPIGNFPGFGDPLEFNPVSRVESYLQKLRFFPDRLISIGGKVGEFTGSIALPVLVFIYLPWKLGSYLYAKYKKTEKKEIPKELEREKNEQSESEKKNDDKKIISIISEDKK